MRILAAPPFRTGSITWQEQPDQWTLTVVCKATYVLEPVVSRLAPSPEDVSEHDNHWDDDPRKSVYTPSDLAPLKPHPEVLVVGSAFAPRGEPVRSLAVRVVVGEVDKSIEVAAVAAPGAREAPRWTQMPLRYERAPGSAGFGPLAWAWPGRREKLGAREASWSEERWTEEPLGDGFDTTFFQAAPPDQWVAALAPDEQLVLEHLHHQHPRLVTRLPGLRPAARVETLDMPAWELTLVADTLWIDTSRALCTLTWRGQVPLQARGQPGVVRIAGEEPGRPARWPSSEAPPAGGEEADFAHTAIDDAALRAAVAAPRPALPFGGSGGKGAPPAVVPPPRATRGTGIVDLVPDDEGAHTQTARVVVPGSRRGGMPAWLESAPAPVPTAPPPPPLHVPPPFRRSDTLVGPPTVATASNAAAGVLEALPPSKRRDTLRGEMAPAPAPPRALVELIWHDPAKVARLRRVAAWEPLLATPSAPPPPPGDDPEAAARAAEERAQRERADVTSVLARATPVSDVEGALHDGASEDGGLTAPLVVVAGELELGLDEVKMLEAMVGAAAAFASGDKKLKEVLDLAGEVMKTPLGASPGVAAGFLGQVRDAWARSSRALPADYLDVHTRRLLLEQRAYQTRGLWSDTYVRALLLPGGEGAGVPTYLPASMARQLPLFARFPARVVAEVVAQQDQVESCPVALRACAVGRVVSGRARGR